MSIDGESEWEPAPHPSGLSFIKISLWTDDTYPGTSEPAESVGLHVHDEENYAIDGEPGTVEEWVDEFLHSHLKGTCVCLGGEDQ